MKLATEFYPQFRATKQRWFETRLGLAENHPHRLETVTLSGTAGYTIDGRDFTAAATATSATWREYTWDLTLISPWTRKFQPKRPWSAYIAPAAPGAAEFVIWHRPGLMWKFFFLAGAAPADVVIGNLEEITYTRPTTGDPWTGGTPVNTDITGQLGFEIEGGGDGPCHGRGDGSDDEKAIIRIRTLFNDLINWDELEILRLPWDDAWSAESTAFSDRLDTIIAAGNTTDGGGHSGSCSFSLAFD